MIYTNPKQILSEIKHVMDLHDIPMKELAIRLNTSQQNISKILGSDNPRCQTLFDICNALNIKLDITFRDDVE